MSQSLDEFRYQIVGRGGFARSHVFRCLIDGENPNSLFGNYQSRRTFLLCRSASLPAFTIDRQELKYFARSVKYPGNRTYDTMSLTFFGTNSYGLRRTFENWQGSLASYYSNARRVYDYKVKNADINTSSIRESNLIGDQKYDMYATITLQHLSVEGILGPLGQVTNRIPSPITTIANALNLDVNPNKIVATYKLFGAFPVRIGPLEFSYDNDAEIQSYQVDFDYQYFIHEEPDRFFSANRTADAI